MRRVVKGDVLDLVSRVSEAKEPTGTTLNGLVANHGSACAAWLVWQHRDSLHRGGALDFRVPKKRKDEVKPFFYVALEKLRRCSKKWKVTVIGKDSFVSKELVFRVQWLQWNPANARSLSKRSVS